MTFTAMDHDLKGYALPAEQGRSIEALHVRLLATGESTRDAMCVIEIVNPGPGGPPLHTHFAHDEWYFVLQGRYRFRIGDRTEEGGPGTFAYVPRGIVHSFASVGTEEGRLLSTSVPGGLEHFLQKMAVLQERGANEVEIVELHAEYQSQINGHPL
jgi:mannose-6-phosphate isomerase-like protein (cupin superfamily)